MREYKGYRGMVEYDPDDRVLHGRVLGIRDVVTFEGRSIDELERAFHDSVDDYLAFCAELGQEPNRPYSGRLMLRLSPDLHRQLDEEAKAHRTSLNQLITEKLERAS
jgi:predicted HicB family RNase H-like nuclease